MQWAVIEGSYTPTPAEPRLRELGVDVIKGIYAECGLEFPEDALMLSRGDEESRRAAELEQETEELLLLELTGALLN